jgi:hypothetical protein
MKKSECCKECYSNFQLRCLFPDCKCHSPKDENRQSCQDKSKGQEGEVLDGNTKKAEVENSAFFSSPSSFDKQFPLLSTFKIPKYIQIILLKYCLDKSIVRETIKNSRASRRTKSVLIRELNL